MRDWILKILQILALANAFGQLALSQIHVSTITKVFINEIGFYLFFFIIFCLLTGFNTFLAENRRGLVFLVLANWVTAFAGYIYVGILQTDVANQQSLAFADVQLSWTLVVAAIVICIVNSLAIPILSWEQVETS